ncbi:Kae1-associated serine/threonine protein kinase [Candidatus Micrarchaeota archaeon]|nr:Kae1-associated serine/threonine protein kinase [Candidatus Micrarchaeota archaeon]MBU1165710.1 Kae1-associated serine/threonine protein kinase [Candidatus Micrarchaeota archaeon]MBU1887077.1 Kae1-associated serine/threonine protein kinase [Candidatus Micrarchaeota archaeon]
MLGAEAIVSKGHLLGTVVAVKKRIEKKYRVKKLDDLLRRERTKSEARLLHRAKSTGVLCPVVLEVSEFEIVMSFVSGKRPKIIGKNVRDFGVLLAKLHSADIIHGDYTPANLLQSGSKLYVIDFGLGFVSQDVEDKAVDVFTMLRAIGNNEKMNNSFLDGYKSVAKDKAEKIFGRVKQVEKRVRYAN